MRPIERIDNFLAKVDWFKLVHRWDIDDFDYVLLNHFNEIVEYWKENPDQRFGQVLINLGLIEDKLNIWIDEEYDILIAQGLEPRDVIFWTSYYDKDNNLLDKPISRLIKDLDTEHIQTLLGIVKTTTMFEILFNELKLRHGKS